MTIPVSLNTISNLQDTTTAQTNINANSAAITGGFSTALNVTGDQMKGNLDMNSNQVLNLPAPASANSPARLVDIISASTALTVPPLGTSGAVVGLLNTNKTDSGNNTFTGTNSFGAVTASTITASTITVSTLAANAFSVSTFTATTITATTLNTAIVNITPSSGSYNQGLVISQTGSSASITGPLDYNTINITHTSAVTGSDGQIVGLNLVLQSGGGLAGPGPVIGGYFNAYDTIPGITTAMDRIGCVGAAYIAVLDPTGGSYGLNAGNIVTSTGSIGRMVGMEADMNLASGGSALYRYAYSAVNFGAATASAIDSVFYIGNIGNTSGAFQNMVVLSNGFGAIPLSTTANMFSYEGNVAATISNVFNFPNLVVSTDILNFPNVVLTGSGSLALAKSATTVAGGSTTAVLSMGSAALGVYFGSGAPTINVPQGSLYMRTDGNSVSTRMYINQGGTSWTFVTTGG